MENSIQSFIHYLPNMPERISLYGEELSLAANFQKKQLFLRDML